MAQVQLRALALALGVRASVAITVPLLIGTLAGLPALLWLGLAGYSAVIADKGGAYRTRAATMAALSVAGAISGVVGGVAGSRPVLSIALMFLWGTGASLARIYGTAASSVGLSSGIIFVLSLALPAPLGASLARGGLIVAGGLWAMLLSLTLWPLRQYRPARLAVARCYRAIGSYAADISHISADPESGDWQARVQGERARIRAELEDARGTLASTRRGRQGESIRGERLLVLLATADRIFAQLLALADLLESIAEYEASDATRAELRRTVAGFSAAASQVAELIEREGKDARAPGLSPLFLTPAAAPTEPANEPSGSETAQAMSRHAAYIAARIRGYFGIAAETAATLESGGAEPRVGTSAFSRGRKPLRQAIEELRESVTRDSVVLQHALRVGITTAAAVLITKTLALPHGYWMTMTTLIVMQPYIGATFIKGAQRIAGTVIGCILAAALAAVIRDPIGIVLLVSIPAAIAVALMQVNYAVYAALLTPAFVLLAEVSVGDWNLAGARMVNTLLGGVLAFIGSRFLWPIPERERFPPFLAAALHAAGEYLERVVETFADPSAGRMTAVAEARRRLGLGAANAEASLQRLITESPGAERLEAPMTLVIYVRRFGAAVTSLASLAGEPQPWADAVGRFARVAVAALDDIANAVTAGRAPPPLPDLTPLDERETVPPSGSDGAGGGDDTDLLRAQLDRIARQLTVLHSAAVRLAGQHPAANADRTTVPMAPG
jgi:uncharacterized membrane protein YccC